MKWERRLFGGLWRHEQHVFVSSNLLCLDVYEHKSFLGFKYYEYDREIFIPAIQDAESEDALLLKEFYINLLETLKEVRQHVEF